MAMMWRALLSWRSPPRSRRWRWRRPDETGIGATPAKAGEVAVAGKPLRASGVPDQDRRGDRPAAGLGEQARAVAAHLRGQLALELVDAARELSNPTHQLAGHAHPRGSLEGTQPPRDALECARSVQLTGGDAGLKFRAEIDEVPAQAVDDPRALRDKVLAVVAQQADLEPALIQKRGREAIDPFAQNGTGDRPRVDLVGLPRLALPTPRNSHQLRRHARDALTGAEKCLLQSAREPATVLDRPDPLVRQPTRPTQHSAVAVRVGLDLEFGHHHAGSGVDCGERVRALVGIRPDHDH